MSWFSKTTRQEQVRTWQVIRDENRARKKLVEAMLQAPVGSRQLLIDELSKRFR